MAPIAQRFLAFVIGALAFCISLDARAFCRATTCDPRKGDVCERNEEGCIRTGAGLRWRSLPISYRFSAAGTSKIDEEAAREIVRKAFANWANVECDGIRTSLSFVERIDSRREGEPFTIHFRDDEWGHDDGDESLALTNQRYGKHTGFIDFADIEVNTAEARFSLGPKEDGIDLETVITHEIGHYIGLAHSNVPGSIMGPRYCQDGSQCGRAHLSDDDVAAVCMLYPPPEATETLAAPPPVDGGCSLAAGARSSGAWPLGFVAALLVRRRWRKLARR